MGGVKNQSLVGMACKFTITQSRVCLYTCIVTLHWIFRASSSSGPSKQPYFTSERVVLASQNFLRLLLLQGITRDGVIATTIQKATISICQWGDPRDLVLKFLTPGLEPLIINQLNAKLRLHFVYSMSHCHVVDCLGAKWFVTALRPKFP